LRFAGTGDARFYESVTLLDDKVAYFGTSQTSSIGYGTDPVGGEVGALVIDIAAGEFLRVTGAEGGGVGIGPLAGTGTRNVRVFSNGTLTAATTAAILEDIGSTRGQMLVRGASAWGVTNIGASGTIWRSDGTDPGWVTLATAGIAAGTGTNNTLTKWTGAATLGNSSVTDDGSTFKISNLSFTTQNDFTLVAGADVWVKLATVSNISDVVIRFASTSSNSEQI
jgi:hypothetical protein